MCETLADMVGRYVQEYPEFLVVLGEAYYLTIAELKSGDLEWPDSTNGVSQPEKGNTH